MTYDNFAKYSLATLVLVMLLGIASLQFSLSAMNTIDLKGQLQNEEILLMPTTKN